METRRILQAVGCVRVGSCPTQPVLSLVELTADKVICGRYKPLRRRFAPDWSATMAGWNPPSQFTAVCCWATARNATEIPRPMDDMWGRYLMALDNVSERLERITRALDQAGVCYAFIGGQAVALWVATVDPSAVRTTKDIDLLLDRAALPTAREAARSIGMDYISGGWIFPGGKLPDASRPPVGRTRGGESHPRRVYFETMGGGMFIDRTAPNPRHGVHIVWAGEKVRPGNPVPAPTLDERQTLPGGRHVVSLGKLVEMKLTAFRDQDRVHLRDMLDVGLIDRSVTQRLPR
ncbi:MAG: nucleotidyl transferase AbiEii/AbiGii toxin family protein [Planctomycetota bacterium]